MKAWFISDLHLKELNERSSISLLRFLHSLINKEREATHLFLLGDIFDLWVGDAAVFVRKFQPIVDAIVTLKKQGLEIFYVEGNHDLHIKPFWQKKLGIPVYVEPEVIKVGQSSIRIEHGDLINEEDIAYLRLRKTLRHPLVEKAAPFISGIVLDQLGQVAAQVSRRFSTIKRERNQNGLRDMIRYHAKRAYQEGPFDLIVTGHMHVQDDYQFDVNGKKVRSINLGSWFDGAKALQVSETSAGLAAEFVEI